MSSLTAKKLTPLCKQIASEHPGWSYVAEHFKYPIGNHSTLFIEPLWFGHVSAQPVVVLTNKKTTKLSKQALNHNRCWMSSKIILEPNAASEYMKYRRRVTNLTDAEEYIRDFFQRGLDLIEQYYNYTDELQLLSNIPIDLEDLDGNIGIGYCLSRVVLHDFDYAYRYVNDEIKTIRPKHIWVERIKPYIPIWEENYKTTGSVFVKV